MTLLYSYSFYNLHSPFIPNELLSGYQSPVQGTNEFAEDDNALHT